MEDLTAKLTAKPRGKSAIMVDHPLVHDGPTGSTHLKDRTEEEVLRLLSGLKQPLSQFNKQFNRFISFRLVAQPDVNREIHGHF